MILHGDSLRLEALELSPVRCTGCWESALTRLQYRVGGGSREGEVVVPRLLTWAQLKRTLGEEDDG